MIFVSVTHPGLAERDSLFSFNSNALGDEVPRANKQIIIIIIIIIMN